MISEEKQLLLKDLCARLPYGVKAKVDGHINPLQVLGVSKLNKSTWAWKKGTYVVTFWNNTKCIDNIVSYLRPMSSMTEGEFEDLKSYSGLKYEQLDLASFQNGTYKCLDFYLNEIPSYVVILVFDWLNKHHFDFRGLIEKGLAIEAPEDMYQ